MGLVSDLLGVVSQVLATEGTVTHAVGLVAHGISTSVPDVFSGSDGQGSVSASAFTGVAT